MPTTLTPITAAFDGFINAISKSSGNLNAFGIQLLFSIATLILVWSVLKLVIKGSSGREILSTSIYLILLTSLSLFLITNLNDIAGKLIKSTDMIAGAVMPSEMQYIYKEDLNAKDSSGAGRIAIQAFGPLFKAAESIWDMSPPKKTTKPLNVISDACRKEPITYSRSDAIVMTPCQRLIQENANITANVEFEKKWNIDIGVLNIADMMTNFLARAEAFVLKLIAMAALLLAGLIAMGHILISQIMVQIAVMIGPIMIPFLIWEEASFIFDGWVKFFIKSLFHKIVGVIMLASMSGGIEAAVKAIDSYQGGIHSYGEQGTFLFMGAVVMVALGILTIMLASQIPNIADGIMSGMSRSGMNFTPRVPSMPRAGTPDKSSGDKTTSTTKTEVTKNAAGKVVRTTTTTTTSRTSDTKSAGSGSNAFYGSSKDSKPFDKPSGK